MFNFYPVTTRRDLTEFFSGVGEWGGGGGGNFCYIQFCSCSQMCALLFTCYTIFSWNGGEGDIRVRQLFRTRLWDLYCTFWSIL